MVVDFWAPWCGPCKQLGPLIEKVVRQANGKVKLVKINIDENQQLAQQMRIQSIPAVFAFVDGRPVDGFMGALPSATSASSSSATSSWPPSRSMNCLIWLSGSAPMKPSTGWPSTKAKTAGIDWMRSCCGELLVLVDVDLDQLDRAVGLP